MRVKYSDEVKQQIQQYSQSLKQYPISKERRNKKVRMLRNYLKKTIKQVSDNIGAMSYPQCMFVDLGQCISNNGKPLNQYLRQTTFSDESKTQWLISFMILEDNKTILIYCLKQAKNVIKESIKITEKQLRRIIR